MSSFQSLDRAIDILFVFSKATPRMTAEEIARKVKLPRGSIYRYINALMENGLIEKNKDKFQLGYKLLYFQSVIHDHDLLETIAYPYMQQIGLFTMETVQLTILKGNKSIPVKSLESTGIVRVAPPIGEPVPLHAGANNKAILAFRPNEEIQKIAYGELEKFTESTIIDPLLLIQELEKIRKDGYAYSYEEMHKGAWGVAAPIMDINGNSIASLGVSGPIFRLTENLKNSTIKMVCQFSKSISEKIHFQHGYS